jgi:hypothetical protein
VSLVDPARRSRFEFSPQMSFGVEIRQYEAFGFVADRQWNVRKALLAGDALGAAFARGFPLRPFD